MYVFLNICTKLAEKNWNQVGLKCISLASQVSALT